METKQPKLKDHGLWLWSHMYKFTDGRQYFYDGTVNASDIVAYFNLEKNQTTYDTVDKHYELYLKLLEHDIAFSQFMIDRRFEDASRRCYEERN